MESEIKRFIFLNPPGIYEAILIVVLFIIVFYFLLRSISVLRTIRQKVIVSLLNFTSIVIILFILFNPALRVENYMEEKPNLAILIDDSWSMNLAGDDNGNSRYQLVKDFFERNRAYFSNIDNSFKIDYYIFDSSLHRTSFDLINNKDPMGKSSNISNAIDELVEENNLNQINTVILLSDGADNQGLIDLSDEELKNIGFEINTIFTSKENDLPDVWIDDIKFSEVGFLRYPISIDVTIKSAGFEGITLPVSLREADNLISIKEVSIDSATSEGKVNFRLVPKSLGRSVYTVSIPTYEDELIHENNQRNLVLDVIVDRIRVLHIAGNPSWDVRFFRKALKRNPNVDLVSFFILREATDLVFASQNELSLIPFPANEILGKELDTFDVVIFQNFNFRPYGIFSSHLESLKNYVEENGGAFLMIGGERSFESGGYSTTPIAAILPIEMALIPRAKSDAFSDDAFFATLTESGRSHPILTMTTDEDENEKNWMELPELQGINFVKGVRPEAITLLKSQADEPLLVINQVNDGKVASFLSDSSWKWSFVRAGEGDVSPYYEKFWHRLLLWLVNDPELKDIRLITDKTSYDFGDKPKLNVLLNTNKIVEQDIITTLMYPSGKEIQLNLDNETEGTFYSQVQLDEYGMYELWARVDDEKGLSSNDKIDNTFFVVEPPFNEISGPTINSSTLKLIADKTGGEFITIEDDPNRLELDRTPLRKIIGYKTIELWDNPVLFILLIVTLTSEWLLRRRWGLR